MKERLNMATPFKLSFHMKTKEAGSPVCYKQDGQRFEQAHTIKLNVNSDYEMRFVLRPGIHIEKLMINGEIHKLELLKNKRVEEEGEEEDGRTYVTEYSTVGYDLSKSGKRKDLLVVLELENGVYMKMCLQCKMYKVGETTHSQWGQKLATIDYECEMEQGHNYVKILKEKYL